MWKFFSSRRELVLGEEDRLRDLAVANELDELQLEEVKVKCRIRFENLFDRITSQRSLCGAVEVVAEASGE